MKFLKEVHYGGFITALYGAGGTDITIRDENNSIVGVGKAERDGSFQVPVRKGDFYQIELKFRTRKANKTLSIGDVSKNLDVDFGKFTSSEMMP